MINSTDITTPVVVTITSNDDSIATVSPTTCNLTTVNHTCAPTVTGVSAGNVTISATAEGYTEVSTNINVIQDVTASRLVIFMTGSTYNGALGGFSGADDKCNADNNKPSTPANASYKALLVGNNATIDGESYYRTNRTTLIATATGGDLVGLNSLTASISADAGVAVWTGYGNNSIGDKCTDWTIGTDSSGGKVGNSSSTSGAYLSETNTGCAALRTLYCVQQPLP